MANNEAQVIASVIMNGDIFSILGEPEDLFGGWADVAKYIKEHYQRYRVVPTADMVEENFGEVALPDPGSQPTQHYLDALKEEFVGSRIDEISLISAQAKKGGVPTKVRLEKMQTALASLTHYTAGSHDLNLMDYEGAAESFIQRKEISDASDGKPGISTGFAGLDCVYPTGMAPGHSIILFGYTGRAKSLWSGLLAVNAWAQGKRILVLSLEMTPQEYRDRIYAMIGNGMFSMADFATGDINPDDFREWAKKKFTDSADFIVVSTEGEKSITPNFVESKIDQYQPDLVIWDYLQLSMDNARTQAMTPRMMNLSREIKLMAVRKMVPIVSISSVTDDDNDKRNAPPMLSQVAWSSAIEYDANVAIAVHLYDDSNIIEVVMRKNRHGPLGCCYFKADIGRGIWVETFDID